MIWGNGEFSIISFPCFPGETENRGNGEYYFPYRTVLGETGKQGEYIYRRYILPFPQFPKGATGAGSSYSFTTYLTSPQRCKGDVQ